MMADMQTKSHFAVTLRDVALIESRGKGSTRRNPRVFLSSSPSSFFVPFALTLASELETQPVVRALRSSLFGDNGAESVNT